MAKAYLICGKICSGKSYYTEKLRRERHCPVLSCDELMLSLFPEQLGSRHEEVSARVQAYLFQKAAELLEAGVSPILEWGFWTVKSRREAEEFFHSRGFETEWHYVEVSDETWRKNLQKRNGAGAPGAYHVDQNLAEKCARLFEPPKPEEIQVWIKNEWK